MREFAARRNGGVETGAVVGDPELEPARQLAQAHLDPVGAGVLAGVGENLLGHAQQLELGAGGEDRGPLGDERRVDAGFGLPLLDEGRQGRFEVEVRIGGQPEADDAFADVGVDLARGRRELVELGVGLATYFGGEAKA